MQTNDKKEIKEELKHLEKKEEPKPLPVVTSKPLEKIKPKVSEASASAPYPSHIYRFPRKDALLLVSICQKCLHANQPLADQIKWLQAKQEKERKEIARDPLIAKDKHAFFH